MYKNIAKQEKLLLKNLVDYQAGQVVSKTLVQNELVSVTVFSFEKDEEISTHASGGDAMVTVLEGTGRFTVGGVRVHRRGRRGVCPHRGRNAGDAQGRAPRRVRPGAVQDAAGGVILTQRIQTGNGTVNTAGIVRRGVVTPPYEFLSMAFRISRGRGRVPPLRNGHRYPIFSQKQRTLTRPLFRFPRIDPHTAAGLPPRCSPPFAARLHRRSSLSAATMPLPMRGTWSNTSLYSLPFHSPRFNFRTICSNCQ